MNYKIIQNEKAFREFIDWLPDLEKDECFYYALFGRSKYDSTGTVKSDKAQLARGVSNKEYLFDKIKKLETKVGTYKSGGISVPQECLALYIMPNPRSYKKASLKTAKEILNNVEKDRYLNPKAVALNALQVSKSRTHVVDFDFDHIHGVLNIKKIVSEATDFSEGTSIVSTRGGYHVLVEPSMVTNKDWHQRLSKHSDQQGDLLLPVPGCSQGGHTVKML